MFLTIFFLQDAILPDLFFGIVDFLSKPNYDEETIGDFVHIVEGMFSLIIFIFYYLLLFIKIKYKNYTIINFYYADAIKNKQFLEVWMVLLEDFHNNLPNKSTVMLSSLLYPVVAHMMNLRTETIIHFRDPEASETNRQW